MKTKYRGINLEVMAYPEDEMIGIYAHQESDGLELICDFEYGNSRVRKRMEYLKQEIDEMFENPQSYGYKVVDSEFKLKEYSDYELEYGKE